MDLSAFQCDVCIRMMLGVSYPDQYQNDARGLIPRPVSE